MFDRTGNVYEYDVTNFNSDLDIKESFFTFDMSEYEDIEVIDLR
jgi:hypothetical protein